MPSIVTNIIKDASGTPVPGAIVTLDLVVLDGGGNPTSVQGFYPATDYSINIPASVSTNINGAWAVSGLAGNDGIEDSGGILNTTHWMVTESAAGISRVYFIKFGEGAPSQIWVGDYTDRNVPSVPSTFPCIATISTVAATTMSAALTRLNLGAVLDLSYAVDIRLDFRVRTAAAGNLLLQWSTDNSTWTTITSISCATTGMKTSGYLSIPGSVRAIGQWQLATSGGSAGSAQLDFVSLIYR